MTDDDNGPRFPPGGMELVYMQVADDLARRIAAGEWGHGDRLPSREQLAAEYGAAQMTIRRAQRELAGRGLIRVVQGKGAYATPGGTPGAHDNDDSLQSTTVNDGYDLQRGQGNPKKRLVRRISEQVPAVLAPHAPHLR